MLTKTTILMSDLNLSNFKFTTIGKQPDLLKRISAPQPDHHYQDISPILSSPSPTIQHTELNNPSRPTLLQVLASVEDPQEHPTPMSNDPVPSLLGIFDKRAAALFAACMSNRPETSSTIMPSPGVSQASAFLRQSPASREELAVKSRFTSPDFTGSMELVYPPTEPATSPAPDIVSNSAADIRSTDAFDSSSDTNTTQSNALNTIISLERDIQTVAAQSLLSLENARRVEALAQRSFATAKESVTIAQENVSLAQATKDLVDQVLIGLAQLVLRCKDDATGGQGCNRRYELGGFPQLITEQARDGVAAQATGLPPEVLYAMVTECAKKIGEYDSRHGSRKRKRSQDHEAVESSDIPYLSHKERRIEQSPMSLDRVLEMEAEAARKAWGQEAERRSMIPPDIAPNVTLGQQEQEMSAESHANFAQQFDRGASGTGQLLQQQVQAPESQTHEQPVAASEQELSPHQGVGPTRGPDGIEDGLQAQRQRELDERKLEIARFQMRERESQELHIRHKEAERKVTVALAKTQKDRAEPGSTVSSAPTRTLAPSNAVASKDALRNATQRKVAAGDISKKKEVEQRLEMEKRQASATVRPGPAQPGDAIQTLAPQSLVDQRGTHAKDGLSASQNKLQNPPPKQPSDTEKGDVTKRQEISEQQRKAEADIFVKAQAESAKLKEPMNGVLDASKSSKPKVITTPNVGNVVAQQTLATSPAKMKGKKSRNPQTPRDSPVQKPGPSPPAHLPPRPQPALPVIHKKNVRLSSVPPIECFVEPSNLGPVEMEISPVSQERDDSRETLPTASSAGINVSSANMRFDKNTVPGIGQNASVHIVKLPRVSTHALVPKVEISSPTIAQSPTIQHPLPPRPRTPKSDILDASQSRTTRRPTPTDQLQTTRDDRLRQSNGDTGTSDKNRRLNTISKTSPIASPPPPPAHLNTSPQDGRPTDATRNFHPINYAAQRTSHQNDLHVAEPSNTYSSAYHRPSRGRAYERFSTSPPRSIGVKRPRVSDRSDDMDGRHWSPRPAPRYYCRTPSGSPPLRFPEDSSSRPLLDRLEETRLDNGGPADAIDWDMRRHGDGVGGYPGPLSDSRPELLDRFSNTIADGSDYPRQVRPGPQHPKRQNGHVPRGTARRGKRGGPLPLEQRIS